MMMRLNFFIILSLHTLFGRLSVENIENAFSEIIRESESKKEPEYAEKIETLKNSIINPIFGYIFESVGGLYNIRFYSPDLKLTMENEIRDYNKDKSDDFITNLLINLFPSPTGTLCHIGATEDNFGYKFKQDKENGVQFLADVFIKSLVPNHTIASNYGWFNEKKNLFECQKDGNKKSESLNDHSITRMIIHSFIINALDSSKDLKLYLKHICEKIEVDNIDKYDINYDIIKEVYEIEKQKKRFTYNKFNYPAQTGICSINNTRIDTYDEEPTFSDCADVVLLHICNCMFYDSENQCYSIGSLKKTSDLAQFYIKYNQLFTITSEIRKEWSKVVQDLDDFNIVNDNEYKTNLIVYVKNESNEVKSGIINMMNILIKICNIDHSKFWEIFDQTSDIQIKLEELFAELSKISGNHVTVDFKNMKFKEFESEGRIDFIGKFYLQFKNKWGMSVVQSDRLSEMTLESLPKIQVLINPEITKLLNASELPLKILARYFLITNGNSIDNQSHEVSIENNTKFNYSFLDDDDTEKVFIKLYFSHKIKTDEQKKDALSNIFEIICKIELDQQKGDKPLHKDKLDILKSIISAILSTVPLTDYATGELFSPYLLYTNYINDDDTLLYCWLESLKIDTIDLYKLYKTKMLKSRIEKIYLYASNKFNGRIEYIFYVLSKMANLKKIKLKLSSNIKEEALKYLSEGLTKLTSITEIDLSENYTVNLDIIKYIFSALKELRNLTKLDVSYNEIGNGDRYKYLCDELSKLTNLEYLDISYNEIGDEDRYKYFCDALSKLTNLTRLNFSGNEMKNSKICKYVGNALSKLTNLEYLNISNNAIGKIRVPPSCLNVLKKTFTRINSHLFNYGQYNYLFKILKSLKKLKEIDLSCNYINSELAKDLALALKELKELTNLDISENCIGKKGTISIMESLSKLTNLQSIWIGYNQIGNGKIDFPNITLSKLSNLKTLYIGGNDLGDEGMESFMMIISTNAMNLTHFYVSKNKISKKGAEFIAGAFKNNKNLIEFSMWNNDLEYEGIKEILNAIKGSDQLRSLDISMNKIGNHDISEELSKFTNLETLDISENGFEDEISEKIKNKVIKLGKLKSFQNFN